MESRIDNESEEGMQHRQDYGDKLWMTSWDEDLQRGFLIPNYQDYYSRPGLEWEYAFKYVRTFYLIHLKLKYSGDGDLFCKLRKAP